MIIDFDEILNDLEVKRASLLPVEELPPLDVAAVVAELPASYDLAGPCRWVADAVATLAASQHEDVNESAALALVRETAVALVARLRLLGDAPQLSPDDLSVLTEAALLEQGAIDVAKALVLRRAHPGREPIAAELRLVRRSGHVVAWNTRKIEVAIRKAFLSLGLDPEPSGRLAERVAVRARSLGIAEIPIETVQDLVQEELVLAGQMRVAERYILYRA